MTGPLAPIQAGAMDAERLRLAGLSVDDLKRDLADSLGLTVNSLIRASLAVQELERRGVDLTELKLTLLPTLRLIGGGQLAPEAAVRFIGRPQLMGLVSRLPIADQRKLGDGESVPMAVRGEDGAITHRLIDPLHLHRDQIHQVFGPDRLRPIEEQIVIVEGRRAASPANPTPVVRSTLVRADVRNNCLRVRNTRLPVADVVAALAELRDAGDGVVADHDSIEEKTVIVKLSEEEHRRLKIHAAESGTTLIALVRRALISHGLI